MGQAFGLERHFFGKKKKSLASSSFLLVLDSGKARNRIVFKEDFLSI